MAPEPRPLFATYLLPSLSLPFRRRQSSTTSAHSYTSDTPPSLSFSPRSSISTSPSSSPPTYTTPHPYPAPQKGLLHEALQNTPKKAKQQGNEERLYRAQPNTLKCVTCATDIAFASQIVSKGFTGRHGRAYLVAPPPTPPYSLTPPPSKNNKNQTDKELINTKIGRNVNRELLTGAHVVADVSCNICCTVLGWKYVDAKEQAQRYKIGKFILEMKRVVQGVGWEDGVDEGEGEAVEEEYMGGKDGGNAEGDDVVVFDEDDEDECEDLFAGVWNPEVVAKRRSRRVGGRR